MPNLFMPKSKILFECKKCNYICSKNSNYQTHLLTAKHNRRVNPTEKNAAPPVQHVCVCGKIYKHITTLYNHRQQCDVYNKPEVVSEMSSHSLDTHSIIEVLKQNQEFKNMLLEQSKQMHESQAHAIELQRQLITAVSDGKLANNSDSAVIPFRRSTTSLHLRMQAEVDVARACRPSSRRLLVFQKTGCCSAVWGACCCPSASTSPTRLASKAVWTLPF